MIETPSSQTGRGMVFRGIVIEESLADKAVLSNLRIVETETAAVTPKHGTPWLHQWTLHTVELDDAIAETVAFRISKSLDPEHGGSWFADFFNEKTHYVIFLNRVFRIDRHSKPQYDETVQYGRSLGIPPHQLAFSKEYIGPASV